MAQPPYTIRWCRRCGVGVAMAHLYATCPSCDLADWIDHARAQRDDQIFGKSFQEAR